MTIIEKIFIGSIIILLTVAYINMGCALELRKIQDTIKKPVAPAIGVFSQYIFMPLVNSLFKYFLQYSISYLSI